MSKHNYNNESISGHSSTGYTVDGSGLGFDSKGDAERYIDDRSEKGQDPQSWGTDYDKLSEYLRTH